MSTKVFNTRLQLKYDSFKNWFENNPVLLAGEIAIVNVPAQIEEGQTTGNATQKPAILFKVGDGTSNFNDLEWASGLAADVYAWAKKERAEAADITVADVDGNFAGTNVEAVLAEIWSEVKTLTGDEEGTGSVASQIAAGIEKLGEGGKTVTTGNYVSGVKIVDGVLVIEETALPDYSNTYADKSLEQTVADHIAAVAEYDTRITAAQTKANEAAQAATDANANAETRVKTSDFETFKTANTKAIEEAASAGTTAAQGVQNNLDAYIESNEDALDELEATVNSKVASVTASDASITIGGEATAPTVKVKVSEDADNALALTENGLKVTIPTAAEYTIRKETTAEEGYAATYKLFKDETQAGVSINIPKDMVVSSGSVVELAEGEVEDLSAGTYIKLVLANANDDTLYIPVGSLIEYVTSGSATGDMVVITVDDDHKVTATITDGTITLAKLETGIQTEINWVTSHKATIETMEGKVNNWDNAEANAKAHAENLIAGLDGDATATAEADGKVSVLTGITQADGVISKASEVTLEKVATTGKLGDLVEDKVADKDTTDYVVFYCGTSEILTK